MKEQILEYRMYGLVPYNLSDIQKAIQYGHAIQEYNNKYFNSINSSIGFKKWREKDKTFIILNGGTTNFRLVNEDDNNSLHIGSLNNHYKTLRYNNIDVAKFYEPDLGDQLTAVVFLVDERVWNREKYPDRDSNPQPKSVDMGGGVSITPAVHIVPETREEYENRLGGPTNVWLREFLKQFRLA